MAIRTVSFGKVAVALLATGLILSAAFAVVGTWQLRGWLRSQSAALGCSLEYASAVAVIPTRFRLRAVQLSACSKAGWSVRVVRASGELSLRSLISGTIQPKHVELELDALRLGGFALDGTMQLSIARRASAAHATARAVQLTLRNGREQLATSSRARFDLEIPLGAEAPDNVMRFSLQSAAMTPIRLTTRGPVQGSLEVGWDNQISRLVLEGQVGTVALELDDEPLEATLPSVHLLASPDRTSVRAELLLTGPDAHVLLAALRVPPSLRFALSALEHNDFRFSSSVSYGSGEWKLEDIRLDTDTASATGVATIRGSNHAGKLRVVYGSVVMGVQFSNDQSDVIFDPAEDWLGAQR